MYEANEVREPAPSRWRAVSCPEVAAEVLGPRFARERREVFAVLLLDARHQCRRIARVSVGSLNASIVHPREVFRPAVVASAAAIILAHNHPSGDPEPSDEDLSITRRLVQVGELLGIGVLDHLIVAERGIVSLRQRGLV